MKIRHKGKTYVVKRHIKTKKNLERISFESKECRLALGLTLKEAAKKARIAVSTLSQIENALMAPSVETLFKLAKAYKHVFCIGG